MKALITKHNYVSVLAAFYVMGFCDVVGLATASLKEDFSLSETMAGFIPSMVFIWFLILSVPSALLMNKYGRKKLVQVSNIVTFVGMVIPFISYNLISCMVAFVLLGVGNTILQVSLNPLLTNVVKGDKLTSCLTAGQVVKAVSSFCGPFIALGVSMALGSWKFIFPIYAIITLICYLMLEVTEIKEEESAGESSSVKSAFGLLKDKTILLYFLGIFFVVGVDVGTNTVSAKLLIERCGMATATAALGASVYFICRTVGAFLGSFLLSRMDEIKYMRVNLVCAAASIALLYFAQSAALIYVGIGGLGFFCSSIFSVIFSEALQARPDQANGISGLMIMGVCGGAVIPPLMGVLTDAIGTQAGSLIVITACALYLAFLAFRKRA